MKKDKGPQKPILREAWDQMTEDFSRFMPEKMRRRPGKMKWFVILSIVELLVLGVLGKYLYDWMTS